MDLFTIILIVCIVVLWFGGGAIQDWYYRGHPLPKSDPDSEQPPLVGPQGPAGNPNSHPSTG